MNKQQTIDALKSAISAHTDTGLITWTINDGDGYVQLVGSHDNIEDEDADLNRSPDLVWTQFGGDSILAQAGLTDKWKKSGTDAYQDKYGDDVVSDWVQFEVEDDEDE